MKARSRATLGHDLQRGEKAYWREKVERAEKGPFWILYYIELYET